MRGFCLDKNGDVVIENGKIAMINGNELLRQTVQCVIATNKGEWFLNKEEGINYRAILKKNPELDNVRDEIFAALLQVDETFVMQDFSREVVGRNLKVKFSAVNGDGEEIGGEAEYGS